MISHVLRKLLHRFGFRLQRCDKSKIHPGMYLKGSAWPKLGIGKNTIINGATIYCWDSSICVDIGNYCSIADDVQIIAGGEHDIDWVTSFPFIEKWDLRDLAKYKRNRWKGHIKIGNDVWVGNRATILSGVTIGNGSVVGACSVVTKSIPPYAIAAGNPAKTIRYRFSEEQSAALEAIKWWNWPQNLIENRAADLLDPVSFIEKYRL